MKAARQKAVCIPRAASLRGHGNTVLNAGHLIKNIQARAFHTGMRFFFPVNTQLKFNLARRECVCLREI